MNGMNAQVFVKIDNYKDVLETMGLVRNKLAEAKDVLAKISQLKQEEDSELQSWSNALDDVQRRVEFMDKELFEPEGL